MPYPAAPWTLRGYSLQALELVDVNRVRPLVPSEFEIVSLLPGKTLGGIYVAHYGEGSTLHYNELIVVAAFTRYGSKASAWISHIYVDNADSVAGGREIWGLPKEMAEFNWENAQNQVAVSQNGRQLCSLRCSWKLKLWRQGLTAPSFSMLGSDLLQFQGKATSNLAMTGVKLEVPAESPFASLGLGNPWFGVKSSNLELVAEAPQVIGRRSILDDRR